MEASELPLWKDMPEVPNMPKGTAWGLFDRDGVKDQYGTLNLLTPKVILRAREEIQVGKSVSLNWPLEYCAEPAHGRKPLEHKFIDWRADTGADFYCHDDEINVNTQAGSQWDGFRHWGHLKTGKYYNGTHHDDLLKGDDLGIHHWHERGGIVGRGVLLDYVAYAERHNIEYSPLSAHAISPSVLKDVAKEQNLKFLAGDILIIRSGFVKWYGEHSDEERKQYITEGEERVGVHGCEEALEFLWDNHFAAVAGDTFGWEVFPPKHSDLMLHDTLLPLWGMPIGEMWDLEELAKECEKQQRWSFFLTSSPLNLKGGVGSPPNAIAIL